MQSGVQPNIGQNNLMPKLAHRQAMLLAMSVEMIRTRIKRDQSQGTGAFGKLVVHRDQLEEYRIRTRGASGKKPIGRPARTLFNQPLPPPRPAGRPRKGGG